MENINYDLDVSPDGMSFLLEKIGADANPLQFIRELTQNAMEAVARTGVSQGKVFWTVDKEIYDQSNGQHSKLSIIDNGDGMSGPEMVEYINRLSSSSSEQSLTGNFGIGAKITAGVRNPHGLVYISWKDGVGSKIHLWKNPETGRYGLKPLKRLDGTMGHWTDDVGVKKPAGIIGDHGTKVIMLG